MPLVNPFAAGQDALLDFLARREQKQMLEEDRARRDRLDQEASADRQRMREIQESQLRSIETDRTERRAAAEAEAQREQANAEQVGQLLDQYTEAVVNGDQQMTMAIGAKILNLGGKLPPAPPKETAPTGFSLSPGQKRFDVTGKMIASVPDRPEKPVTPKVATPGQKIAAKQQAMRNAILHEREGLLPEGMTVQEYAQQLEDEYLTTLGFDVPERPTRQAPQGSVFTGHQGTPDPTRPGASSPGGDINLPVESSGPAASKDDPTTPPEVQTLLANVPVGKRVKLSDGSVWDVTPQGPVRVQ